MSVWERVQRSAGTDAVAAQLRSGEAPHGWLLVGARGSGKRGLALVMAAALECEQEPGVGCGQCRACARILRARHPDVHHVLPEGAVIPVDVIRESVIPEATRSPFEAKRKVFVIEDAERMNAAAQNALLKTLEEPGPETVFILIANHEDELLETITSRCRIVRLSPVPEESVAQLLGADGIGPDDARLYARIAKGDVELARALATDPAYPERRSVWMSIPSRLGSSVDALDIAAEVVASGKESAKAREREQKAEVIELAEAMGEGRGTATARTALAKRHKRELKRVEEEVLIEALEAIGSFYKDVLAFRHGARSAITNIDRVADLEAWAGSPVHDRALVQASDRCATAAGAFSRNANPLMTIESVLLELAELGRPSRRSLV